MVDDKKVKTLINIIHRKKHKYLNLKTKSNYLYSNGDEELINFKSNGLYIVLYLKVINTKIYTLVKERKELYKIL